MNWTSSNPGVATVSAAGLVTGVGAGTATITATTVDGGYTATSAVTVTAVANYLVNIGNAGDDMTYGGSYGFVSRSGDYNNDETALTNSGSYCQYTFTGIGVDVLGFKPVGGGSPYSILLDGNMITNGSM